MKNIIDIANEMLNEAEGLKNDTMVSMSEGICNEYIAEYLTNYAKRILKATENPHDV